VSIFILRDFYRAAILALGAAAALGLAGAGLYYSRRRNQQ